MDSLAFGHRDESGERESERYREHARIIGIPVIRSVSA